MLIPGISGDRLLGLTSEERLGLSLWLELAVKRGDPIFLPGF